MKENLPCTMVQDDSVIGDPCNVNGFCQELRGEI